MPFITKIFELSRPLHLLLTTLCYGLGLGVARYLGQDINLLTAFLGGMVILLLTAAARLAERYFSVSPEPFFENESEDQRNDFKRLTLYTTLLLFGAAALLVSFMLIEGLLNPTAALFFAGVSLMAVVFGVPPMRIIDRGFGEFGLALFMGAFTPAAAFSLQTGEIHRLLSLVTFPLFALALACLLAFDFPDFAVDLKRGRRTMLIRLTWQRAILVHNLLLAAAYLFFASALFMGLSFALVWPALLTLPLAVYQVFMLARISDGAKPVWPAFKINAAAIFGLTAYLLTITFWLR